jgi:hypothetical protein
MAQMVVMARAQPEAIRLLFYFWIASLRSQGRQPEQGFCALSK